MISRIACIIVACFVLAGCQSGKMLTSIPGGESKVFEAPPYEVKGQTQYDQNWIDSQVEGGVAAFGWPRPAPRPPELAKAGPPRKVVAPAKKKGIVRRIKDRVSSSKLWPAKTTAPVEPTPAPPEPTPAPVEAPAIVAAPQPAPPAKPRDTVDELLDPTPMPKIRVVR